MSAESLRVWIPTNRFYDNGKPAGMDALNEIIDANRRSKNMGARLEREDVEWCAWHIRKAMLEAGWASLTEKTACECIVYMRIVEPSRRRDVPNVYGGCAKYVLDACTARHELGTGAIYDDSVRWLSTFNQKIAVDPRKPGIDLTIIRLTDGKEQR